MLMLRFLKKRGRDDTGVDEIYSYPVRVAIYSMQIRALLPMYPVLYADIQLHGATPKTPNLRAR